MATTHPDINYSTAHSRASSYTHAVRGPARGSRVTRKWPRGSNAKPARINGQSRVRVQELSQCARVRDYLHDNMERSIYSAYLNQVALYNRCQLRRDHGIEESLRAVSSCSANARAGAVRARRHYQRRAPKTRFLSTTPRIRHRSALHSGVGSWETLPWDSAGYW